MGYHPLIMVPRACALIVQIAFDVDRFHYFRHSKSFGNQLSSRAV
jgi:hypothetical protein